MNLWYSNNRMRGVLTGLLVFSCVLAAAAAGAETAVYPFSGSVNLAEREADVRVELPEEASIEAKWKQPAKDEHRLSVHLNRIQTSTLNFSSEIQSTWRVSRGDGSLNDFIEGRIWSDYTLIDYKPVENFSGDFTLRGDTLDVETFRFGNVTFGGDIDLTEEEDIALTAELEDVGMRDFFHFWTGKKEFDTEGLVNGSIQVTGNLANLRLKGNLETQNGYVKRLSYNKIHLNAEGVYPELTIARSSIAQSDGLVYAISGNVDLSDKENFEQQIKELKAAPMITESASESEWTIRRLETDEKGTTELKYLLRKQKGLTLDESESDMIGIERKMEF